MRNFDKFFCKFCLPLSALSPQICQFFPSLQSSPAHSLPYPPWLPGPSNLYMPTFCSQLVGCCLLIPTKALPMLCWARLGCIILLLKLHPGSVTAPDIPGFSGGTLQPGLPGTCKPKPGSWDRNDPWWVVRCDMTVRDPGADNEGVVLTSCSHSCTTNI